MSSRANRLRRAGRVGALARAGLRAGPCRRSGSNPRPSDELADVHPPGDRRRAGRVRRRSGAECRDGPTWTRRPSPGAMPVAGEARGSWLDVGAARPRAVPARRKEGSMTRLRGGLAAAALALAPAAQAATNIIPAGFRVVSWPGTAGVLRAGSPWGPGSTPSNPFAPVDGLFRPGDDPVEQRQLLVGPAPEREPVRAVLDGGPRQALRAQPAGGAGRQQRQRRRRGLGWHGLGRRVQRSGRRRIRAGGQRAPAAEGAAGPTGERQGADAGAGAGAGDTAPS